MRIYSDLRCVERAWPEKNVQIRFGLTPSLAQLRSFEVKPERPAAQWASWKAKCAKIGIWLPPNFKFWGVVGER